MKKEYSKEFILSRLFQDSWVKLQFSNNLRAGGFCAKQFYKQFGIPPMLLNGRKHRVKITIKFLKELP